MSFVSWLLARAAQDPFWRRMSGSFGLFLRCSSPRSEPGVHEQQVEGVELGLHS
jgi:hypothetical protein